MKQDKNQNLLFSDLLNSFIIFLESKSYARLTLVNYQRTLKKIELYMNMHGIHNYSVNVGLEYYNHYIQEHNIKTARQSAIYTAIRRLNDFYSGNEYVIQHLREIEFLPDNYENILSRYAQHCCQAGNKDNTVKSKCQFVRYFLRDCIYQGCPDIVSLNPAYVVKACVHVKNKDGWAAIRAFLEFVNRSGIHESDFSTLVPHFKRPIPIPVTYAADDIRKLENIIDRESDIGKRDYAFILLITRLGMRSGDIVNLTFDKLDFKNNAILFIQQKTKV